MIAILETEEAPACTWKYASGVISLLIIVEDSTACLTINSRAAPYHKEQLGIPTHRKLLGMLTATAELDIEMEMGISTWHHL